MALEFHHCVIQQGCRKLAWAIISRTNGLHHAGIAGCNQKYLLFEELTRAFHDVEDGHLVSDQWA